jgi:hypothetical protein
MAATVRLFRASCPPPFGPAALFKAVPDSFVASLCAPYVADPSTVVALAQARHAPIDRYESPDHNVDDFI